MNTLPTLSGGCSACGTSPVNHRLAKVLNLFDEVGNKITELLHRLVSIPYEPVLANAIGGAMTSLLALIGLIRFSDDRSKALSGRSELIWNEAESRGIVMQQIVLGGRYLEQYRARVNGKWYHFQSIPVPPWLPQKGYAWMDDKFALARKLEDARISVPGAHLAISWSEAERAFKELTKPVIVKPRFGSRSRHTTTNINTLPELRVAYDLAKQIAREIVVEEHLHGSVCRATVVGGKLVGFFLTEPPKVVGDGTRTVKELIDEKNATRHERLGDVEITDDLISNIARRGYTLESVLPAGLSLDLHAKVGRYYGGYTKEMLPEVHPRMHEIFARTAALIDAPVMGFDLIIADPTQDPSTQRWGIIECNSLPFIDLHYYALEGAPNDLAPYIWDLWMY